MRLYHRLFLTGLDPTLMVKNNSYITMKLNVMGIKNNFNFIGLVSTRSDGYLTRKMVTETSRDLFFCIETRGGINHRCP